MQGDCIAEIDCDIDTSNIPALPHKVCISLFYILIKFFYMQDFSFYFYFSIHIDIYVFNLIFICICICICIYVYMFIFIFNLSSFNLTYTSDFTSTSPFPSKNTSTSTFFFQFLELLFIYIWRARWTARQPLLSLTSTLPPRPASPSAAHPRYSTSYSIYLYKF